MRKNPINYKKTDIAGTVYFSWYFQIICILLYENYLKMWIF